MSIDQGQGQPLPMVTVVIPTRNRREMLRAGLESLLRQSYPRDRYEVIVVDNGSTDGTEEMVSAIGEASNGLVRYLRQENLGPAVARNRGIQEGKGEIVAFTDSDCLAHSDWIREGVEALLQDDALGLISGRVLPVPRQEIGFLSRLVQLDREHPFYPACNIFYRHAALSAVGGFSPFFKRFRHHMDFALGGEDTELAWRVKRAGWKSGFAAQALIFHEIERLTPFHYLIHDPGHAQLLPYLVRVIPELRRHLFLGYFLSTQTALFDLLLLGLLLAAAVHPAFLLLGVPFSYYAFLFARLHKRKRLVIFPFWHLYYGAVFVFVAYGSIKHRSLVL